MRWRGLARSRDADLPIARPLTPLNRSPGPETRRKTRFPGPSYVAGVSPGRSPFPATRDFYALRKASTRGFADNLKDFSYPHAYPHSPHRYPPRRRIFHRLIHSSVHSRPGWAGLPDGPDHLASLSSAQPSQPSHAAKPATAMVGRPEPGAFPAGSRPVAGAPHRARALPPTWLAALSGRARPGSTTMLTSASRRCARSRVTQILERTRPAARRGSRAARARDRRPASPGAASAGLSRKPGANY